MRYQMILPILLIVFLGGCAEMESLGSKGGTKFGESSGTIQSDRNGTISNLESVHVDKNYKLGVGTAAGAVAGGILGSAIGDSTTATVAGAVIGGLAGTYAETKMGKETAQQVTVNMVTGGTVTITQPTDARLKEGMAVRVEGSGESARVVPR
jgi:outer membrane lipoprotein SlyB